MENLNEMCTEELPAIEIEAMPEGHYSYRTEGETENASNIKKFEFLD